QGIEIGAISLRRHRLQQANAVNPRLGGLHRDGATQDRAGRSAERDNEVAPSHSITASARASRVGGTSMPIALAVLRLITNSNLVGCSTGISAGLVPRRILSASSAARRKRSGMFGPYDIKPPA